MLRVMSYNVHDLLDDRAAAARVVRAVAPDVLCLQEVPRRLTTELRLPPFARDCRLVWRRGRLGTGGTAVLTAPRVVVHDVRRARLRVRFPDRTRGYAAATVSLAGGGLCAPPVTVVSVHLGLRPSERWRHAGVVLGGLDGRAVVAGDLNEGPGDAAYDRIAALHPAVTAGVATYPAHRPTVVLDAIFAGRDLRVVSTAAVVVDERDLATGSDHRPVWVDLDLAGTGPRQLARS
ncbi:endonuclease/exonuclease/phosphatase family protein [Terrabacter ginsenosidimutans]|uniref:Endonuclease/exonuclease/phosphatase family protein n=2 Tax=Terrabacter ginsenosidimutans TaxID=490575 RepID=A0ABP7DG30_9MICO